MFILLGIMLIEKLNIAPAIYKYIVISNYYLLSKTTLHFPSSKLYSPWQSEQRPMDSSEARHPTVFST